MAEPDACQSVSDSIVPDSKDWTWVLQRPCPECGFVAADVQVADVAPALREQGEAWPRVLHERGGDPRPRPDVWSPLEYACHVRDVLRLYDVRLRLMLAEDDPLYPNWDQDATAVADRYGEQDPVQVAGEIAEAATVIADRFAGLAPEQWQRTGRRSDGAAFTVTSFARYFLHDVVHHIYDVTGRPARTAASG